MNLQVNKRFHRFTGEFLDAGLEHRYRLSVQDERAQELCNSLLLVGGLFLLACLFDFIMVEDPDNLQLLLATRITVVSGFLLLAVAVKRNSALAWRMLPLNLVILLMVSMNIMLVPLRPETLNTQLTAVVTVTLTLYFFMPNRTQWIVFQCLLLCSGFVIAILAWGDVPSERLLLIWLAIMLANLIGWFTLLRLNRLHRGQYASLQEAKEANRLLQQEIAERERLEDSLRHLAQTDPLTGLQNRRSFLDLAEKALRQSLRTGTPLSLCMLDIDHFKAINDSQGHAAGDSVLVKVAALCTQNLRDHDLVGRYGGEEFIIALPNTDADEARTIAERLRASIEHSRLSEIGDSLTLTVTIGISQLSEGEETLDATLQRADDALYEGKREGRNCLKLALA